MSQKDRWDKAEVIGTILTPILVVCLGLYIQSSLPNNDQAASLAAEILMSNPTSQSRGLRIWALDVLEKSSKIPIPDQVRDELASHPLSAQALQFDETEIRFHVFCGGKAPLCPEHFRTAFKAESENAGERERRIRVLLSDGPCQPIRLHIFLNEEKIFESEILGRSSKDTNTAGLLLSTPLIPLPSVKSGVNEISIQAEGFSASCSPDGHLGDWGGTFLLLTSKTQAIP